MSFFLSVSIFTCAFAASTLTVSDFAKHETGWHWYEKRKSPPDEEHPSGKVDFPAKSASEQLTFIKKHIENVRSEAILSPTPAHVKAYIALQNAITWNAELFSRVWQQVLMENPALRYASSLNNTKIDYSALPIEKVQEETPKETIQTEMSSDTVLHDAHHTWGLLYFFTSTCPYCQRFSPVVKAVSERYHLDTLAVSVNGEGLPDFLHPVIDNGEAAMLHVTHLPALFLVAPQTRDIQRVTEGEISESELIMRLNTVLKRPEEKNDETHKTHPSNSIDDKSKTDEVAKMYEKSKSNEIHETDETNKAKSDEPNEMNEFFKRGDFNNENE